ncbi:hypothetical protein V6R21_12580 [Limibacter armeniacum]|uniref:hypothetical protein n=1 Tax=Limibacter armeniacum TaxID=466084 RepID=UPI002FE66FFD
MKTHQYLNISNMVKAYFFLLFLFLCGCHKEDLVAEIPNPTPPIQSLITISFSLADITALSDSTNTATSLTSGCDYSETNINQYKALVNILKADDSIVYKELNITKRDNDKFILETFELEPANYTITSFILVKKLDGGSYSEAMVMPSSGHMFAKELSDQIPNEYELKVKEQEDSFLDIQVICKKEDIPLSDYGYMYKEDKPVRVKKVYAFANYCDENGNYQVASITGKVERLCTEDKTPEVVSEDKANAVATNGGSKLEDDFICLTVHDDCNDKFRITVKAYPYNTDLNHLDGVSPEATFQFHLTYDEVCILTENSNLISLTKKCK